MILLQYHSHTSLKEIHEMLPNCCTELHCIPCGNPYTSPLAKPGLSNFQPSNAFYQLLLEVNTYPYLLLTCVIVRVILWPSARKTKGLKSLRSFLGYIGMCSPVPQADSGWGETSHLYSHVKWIHLEAYLVLKLITVVEKWCFPAFNSYT